MSEQELTEETAQGMAGLEYWLSQIRKTENDGVPFFVIVSSLPMTDSAQFASANGL